MLKDVRPNVPSHFDGSHLPVVRELLPKVRSFVDETAIPLEADPASYDDHENIDLGLLETLRAKTRALGIFAPQVSKEQGGMGLKVASLATLYEEMNR